MMQQEGGSPTSGARATYLVSRGPICVIATQSCSIPSLQQWWLRRFSVP